MGVTISTHNGSAVAREHNIRNRKVTSKEGHIDPHGRHEIWIDEKPKEAYERLFGQAVEKYNDKQKRADRKIKDYYQQICGDKKKHAVYEMIISVGDRTNYADGTLREQDTRAILREFVDGWQARNPHLTLIGAYYHADEQGAPHAHLDYIPVAHGYKRGLETQSALVKALEQQGFVKDGKETAQIQWERRENAHLESLCLSKGIEVVHPLIEGRKHIETEMYKATQDLETAEFIAENLNTYNSILQHENEILERELKNKESDAHIEELFMIEAEEKLNRLYARQEIIERDSQSKEWIVSDMQETAYRHAQNKISQLLDDLNSKVEALDQCNQELADVGKQLRQIVNNCSRDDLLYRLASYCDGLQMGSSGETAWEYFFRGGDTWKRSIDNVSEAFQLRARLLKEKNADEGTPQTRRTNEQEK